VEARGGHKRETKAIPLRAKLRTESGVVKEEIRKGKMDKAAGTQGDLGEGSMLGHVVMGTGS